MNSYISSGAWFVQVIGIGIIGIAYFHTKDRHDKARKRGSTYFSVELFLLLPWYIAKSLIFFLGVFFILVPFSSL
ncbi:MULTISPECIES: hypothetical protein [Bacillaceae]|uniref:Uncharacterized protein n=1 Tax=Gottfriedia luciferensis TaxID=178774 RepID=A0ABX3A2A7_9BACI|nr:MULTISPECIES: hypothetical protein [Bacillaceae]ODG93453.1 hypothetical protein BED47_03970 [Gottfriedia luciferensis]PGZ93363.1 hypothetical protein COE53_06590 [Bacillus sp. AFS029533]SFC46452.1 hypothetical protein SAMN02799633_00881 [Bacillus sp. UNCCL81]